MKIPDEQWVPCQEEDLRPGMTVRARRGAEVVGPFIVLGSKPALPRHWNMRLAREEKCLGTVAWVTTLGKGTLCLCAVRSHLERLRDLDAGDERTRAIMCDLDDLRLKRERLRSAP